MSGERLIFLLQCLVACAWAVPLIRKWSAVCRVWAGRNSGDDLPRATIWFVAASTEFFSLRWVLFPNAVRTMTPAEIYTWSGCYVLSIVAALAVSWAYWERSHDGR